MNKCAKLLISLSIILTISSSALAAGTGYPSAGRAIDATPQAYAAPQSPPAASTAIAPSASPTASATQTYSTGSQDSAKAYPLASLAPAAGGDADATTATAVDEFTINAGDVLQVTVWKEDGLDREVLVLPDGTITFPLIGTLDVKGLTPKKVQNMVKDKLRKLVPDASVTVMVKAPLGHTVNVLGQVVKSGEIVIGRRMSVMEALSQAGGLTAYASEGNIIIIRYVDGKKTSIPFPYDDVAKGRHLDKDIDLKPGDVVFVPTAGLF